MKYLRATSCKDGFHVVVTETHHMCCETDLFKFVKQQGLELKPQFYEYGLKDRIVSYYAE